MESGDGSVVREAVLTADDAEADDVALIVEDLESLGAVIRRKAGDDLDLAESAYVAVADDDVTALDEVLVSLGIVESPDDRPDRGDRCGDLLDHSGARLVRSNLVRVVTRHSLR